MRWGVLGRADDRGLGHITWDVVRHLHPDSTAIVDMGEWARGFPQRFERFPDATRLTFIGTGLEEGPAREWMRGLDVVFAPETFYDPAFVTWAEEERVATALLVMPEFYRREWPAPTVMWAPTTWRIDTLPPTTRLVPVPVETRPAVPGRQAGPLRLLHVAGHRAMADRNGTTIMGQALRWLRPPMEVDIHCQDARLPAFRSPRGVTLRTHLRGVPDRWDQYAGADVLVLPRRYGGLALPASEAAACGLGLVMTDCPPNTQTWPALGIPCARGASIMTACGEVPLHNADPRSLAAILNRLAADPAEMAQLRERSREWARANSWEALGSLWMKELERVAAG